MSGLLDEEEDLVDNPSRVSVSRYLHSFSG